MTRAVRWGGGGGKKTGDMWAAQRRKKPARSYFRDTINHSDIRLISVAKEVRLCKMGKYVCLFTIFCGGNQRGDVDIV